MAGRPTDTIQRARSQASSDPRDTEESVQELEDIDTSAGISFKPIDGRISSYDDLTGSATLGSSQMQSFLKAGIQLQQTAISEAFNNGSLDNLFQSALKSAIAPLLLHMEKMTADIQRIEGKIDGITKLHGDQIYILNQHRQDISTWGSQLLQQVASMWPFSLSNAAPSATYSM